ncbi:ABC transporter permease [Thermogladius sp. 4427co]|uniref:ABC transporter permease n=1 Tax=Thermogladius sp. 4427co TaxID=3450718 RepID=UPI003F797E93
MPGAGRVILRRAVLLAIAFILIVILTAVILEGTGFAQRIYQALVTQNVQADVQVYARTHPGASPTDIQEFKNKMTIYWMQYYGIIDAQGNPVPPYIRMWKLVFNSLRLDFGYTSQDAITALIGKLPPQPVIDVIAGVLPRTILMATVAELICAAIALPLAPRIAYKHGSLWDRLIVSYAALFNAVPVWWLAMIMLSLFGYTLRIFPTNYRLLATYMNNFWSDPLVNMGYIAWYSVLPVVTLVIAFLSTWLYSIRAMVLRIVREDYVMVAKAKGLPEKDIARKYIVRVMAPPIVTYVILALAGSLGGLIITESVFDWPGMGTLTYAAITTADVNTVMGVFFILVLVYILARLVLEILYILLDPRVRYR